MTEHLADAAARALIRTDLDATLFVEAGAGSGKTRSLIDRVCALIGAGTELRHIAAITFTEKAATELRDRIRAACEHTAGSDGDPAHREAFRAALEQVDAAAVSTLHGFAQRILTKHPVEAGLPPNVAVLDEVASEIAFEDRWTHFRDALLDDPAHERCLLLAFAAGIRPEDLRRIAVAFNANWDQVADPARLPWEATDPPAVDNRQFIARIAALLDRRAECADPADRLCAYLAEDIADYLARLRAARSEDEALALLAADKPTFKPPGGQKRNWDDKDGVVDELRAIGESRRAHAEAVACACVQRLAVELGRFTLEAAEARRASGQLEFHDLLVLARDLLRGVHGPAVRRRLRGRCRRLLLDEFHDTDPIQIELAVLLASPDHEASAQHWPEIATNPGRLFFVGDPKQSIHRFRRADIALYLEAARAFGDPPVTLSTNFRSAPALIDWVNHVFTRLFAPEPGSQPAYQRLDAAPGRGDPPDGTPVVLLGREPHADAPKADELREREAADVADAVRAACGWQVSRRERDGDGPERWEPARLGDIAILLPARTSLPALERALDEAGFPYRAESSSLVYATREVRDLLTVARALDDATDQLALVAALRSAVFGCGDDDLFTYKVVHGGGWHPRAPVPNSLDAEHPVVAALGYLAAVGDELPWLTPAELLDRVCRDRRLFELGYAQGRPRDVWRRLRFVIDQARAWSEAEGGTLREYLAWAQLQASEQARVAETILPETDDDAVRIMTVHAAKGLEFPIVILSGTGTRPQGRYSRVEVAFPPAGPVGLKVGKDLATEEFERHAPVDEQMGFHERLRLLYVACTRAQDHLVVSLHRPARTLPGEPAKRTNAELLAAVCVDAPHHRDLDADEAAARAQPQAPAGAPLPDLAVWEAERARALAASGRRRSLGASDVALAVEADEDVAAGAAKQPRDLELPPWLKGRYGTAVGRAVHEVLQTIDLATGAGLDEAAAAQAAAEGVMQREGDIRALAAAALEAPSVREAVGLEHWRETYVATTVGDRTLEGYIDLLYRTKAGLVIVDYKTAATGADLDARVAAYRAQGGAYALAVAGATAEPVARVVFCFLTPAGAIERDLRDLRAAIETVRDGLQRGAVGRAHGTGADGYTGEVRDLVGEWKG